MRKTLSFILVFSIYTGFSYASEENEKKDFCSLYSDLLNQSPGEKSAFSQTIKPFLKKYPCGEIFDFMRNQSIVWATGQDINDDSLKIIGKYKSVKRLRLEGSSITDDGLDEISSLTNLRRLYLDNTSVSDEGIKKLAHLPNLWLLTLRNTNVSEEGIAYIREHNPKISIWEQ